MKSNRNKMRPELGVNLRGNIPKRADGWGPYSDIDYGVSGFLLTDLPPQLYLGNQTQDDWDDWTILRLGYGCEGVWIPPLIVFSEDTQSIACSTNFHATEVRYACVGMPQSIRQRIMEGHFRGCYLSDIDNRIPSFFEYLAKNTSFNQVVTKGTRLTYEFRYMNPTLGFI
jgi:hypothetical protein